MSHHRMYIEGAWCNAASGAVRDAINPAKAAPFGPIAPIRGFSYEDAAWRYIHGCDLGLVSDVFTEALDQASDGAERLCTGSIVSNDPTNYWVTHMPSGDVSGTQSGVERLGGKHTLEFPSNVQALAFPVNP